MSSQLGEAGWLGHEAGRAQADWSSAGLTLKAPRGVRPREKLAMLLWVPQALLALLLPTLLAQGEGKEAVGKHTGPAGSYRGGRGDAWPLQKLRERAFWSGWGYKQVGDLTAYEQERIL